MSIVSNWDGNVNTFYEYKPEQRFFRNNCSNFWGWYSLFDILPWVCEGWQDKLADAGAGHVYRENETPSTAKEE